MSTLPLAAATSPFTATTVPSVRRFKSVDALRGFDMFWILGADAIISGLRGFSDNAVTRFLAEQFDHKDWQGFAFYDLIFPLFVFIVGVSLVFSLSRIVEREGRRAAVWRVLRRSVLLYLVGVFYYGGFSKPWPEIRLLGVLQRIALCYLFAGLCFCLFKPRTLAGIAAGLLVGYWLLLSFVPFPDVRPVPGGDLPVARETGFTNVAQLRLDAEPTLRGVFIKGVNVAHYVDQRWLPGYRWDGTWDPEGLLSTLPAIVTCLCGVFAGLLLQDGRFSNGRKLAWLLVGGAAAVALGWLWHLQFPVIKKIWTSSYVLVAAGYSAWLLGAFYYIVDMRGWERWAMPFIWIGMNPITVYLGDSLIHYDRVAERFAGGSVRQFLDQAFIPGLGEALIAVITLAIPILLCRFLYRRQIFLRL